MRNNLLIILVCMWSNKIEAQAFAGFEQYFYADKTGLLDVVPVLYFQNQHNWYVQADMNYEQMHTYSVCIGKIFAENDDFSYSVTPMVGAVLGSLKGGIVALNTEMKYRNISFVSQSHYVFSFKNIQADLLNNWMELGYKVVGNVLIGASMQTSVFNASSMELETGVFMRFSVRKWNFPIYIFRAMSENRYLILGVNREFSLGVKKKAKYN
jgi:hypothetical protein